MIKQLAIITFALTTVFAFANAASAQEVTATHVNTHHDSVPRPCPSGAATITSRQTGDWGTPTTWAQGRVPGPSDTVAIVGHDIAISGTRFADCIEISGSGTLNFSSNQNTTLTVADVVVLPDGTLTIGTTTAPIESSVTAELILKDKPLDLNLDPQQWNRALIVFGTVNIHGQEHQNMFMRLRTEPQAGDRTLSMLSAVSWPVGSRVLLPDSRSLKFNEIGDNYTPQWEVATITAISADGRELTLSQPLQYAHPGAYNGDGTPALNPHSGNNEWLLPHAALLDSNVIVRSATPVESNKQTWCTHANKLTGQDSDETQICSTRAHTAWMAQADTDVRYAVFRDLGRTVFDRGFTPTLQNPVVDNTTFDGDGNVTHYGENQIARYPVHTHHLVGPVKTSAPAQTCNEANSNGTSNPAACQFVLIGNIVDGGLEDHTFRWSYTIHGSHYGLIQNNVSFNVQGAAFVAEDGTETGNVFASNYAAVTDGHTTRLNSGDDGVGFWLEGPLNFVRGNVASTIGVSKNYTYGFAITPEQIGRFAANGRREITIPMFQGADPHSTGQSIDPNAQPIAEFDNNELYGASERGLTIWWVGQLGPGVEKEIAESYVDNFRAWNYQTRAYLGYPNKNIVIRNMFVRGSDKEGNRNAITGIRYGDYVSTTHKVIGADVQGTQNGIEPPWIAAPLIKGNAQSGEFVMEDSVFAFNNTDVLHSIIHRSGSADFAPSRKITLRNNLLQSDTKFKFLYRQANGHNAAARDQIIVEDHQQQAGSNFELYWEQSRPDVPFPQTGTLPNGNPGSTSAPFVGCPDAGKTNLTCVAAHPTGFTHADRAYATAAHAGVISPCAPGNANLCPNADVFEGLIGGDAFATSNGGSQAPTLTFDPDQTTFTVTVGNTINIIAEAVAATGKTIQSLTAQSLPTGASFE